MTSGKLTHVYEAGLRAGLQICEQHHNLILYHARPAIDKSVEEALRDNPYTKDTALQGKLLEVWVVHDGDRDRITEASVMAVHLYRHQAQDYLENELGIHNPNAGRYHVTSQWGFQPYGQDRVTLFRAPMFFQLSTDFTSEPARRKQELCRSAWERLTPEEREAIGLREPK